MKQLVTAVFCITASLQGQTFGTFAPTGGMGVARSRHTATLLPDGRVLVVGGTTARAEIYDPSTGTFSPTGSLISARSGHTATLLPNGKVLIAGGTGAAGTSRTAELYDPSTGTFSATGSMSNNQLWHSANLLADGRVLISGGTVAYPLLVAAELYDPDSGTFRAAGPYAVPSYWCEFCPPAVTLANGQVLLGGTRFAQLYDAATDTFQALSGTTDYSTATLLGNGSVLLSGGEWSDSGRLLGAAVYDPLKKVFLAVNGLAQRRVWHSATTLADGSALVAGGETDACNSAGLCIFDGSMATAEVFDVAQARFRQTGSLGTLREQHTATLLNDGRVLVTGGVIYRGIGRFEGSIASAELYTPQVQVSAPFLYSAGGTQGAVLHAGTARVVTSANPAASGDYLEIYAAGLLDGAVVPPQIVIGGRLAEVTYFGPSGYPGVNQINVRMPAGVAPGTAAMRMSYLGRFSNEVTIAAR